LIWAGNVVAHPRRSMRIDNFCILYIFNGATNY
jgi:hypothetical protein